MTPSLWPSLLAFVAVIALIPLVLAVVKRAQGLRPQRQGMLTLLGGLAVGPRERIAVVEAGGKWLVVGITAQSINLLLTLDERPATLPARTPGSAPGASSASSSTSSPFAAILAAMKKHHEQTPT